MRVQLAFEEERAPALGATLDDEGDRADDPDRDKAPSETQAARALGVHARVIGRDEEGCERDDDGDGDQDWLAARARAPREPGAHRADEHADRVGAVRDWLQPLAGRVLDPADVRVDRHVDEARGHPARGEREHERGERRGEARQQRCNGEERAADGNRARPEAFDRARRDEEHHGDRPERHEEHRDAERALREAGRMLDARQHGRPRAPEETEREEAREGRCPPRDTGV